MTNKEKAKQFLQLASAGKVDEAYAQFIAEDFIHHNQYFKGDRKSLMQGMKDAPANKTIDIKMILEDGDKVTTLSHVKMASGTSVAVVHIFRFKNDKVAELWDLGQIIAA